MPSVGMRRSTRVFGARVLRSGRRLSTIKYDGNKHGRAAHGEDKWTELLNDSADGGDAGNQYKSMWQKNECKDSMNMIAETGVEGAAEVKKVNRMCRIVYQRKRKRMESIDTAPKEDKRYGKKYLRGQWRKKGGSTGSAVICRDFHGPARRIGEFTLVVSKSNHDSGYWITCLLTSILSYMTRARIRVKQLSAFLLSKPICDAYSSHGVVFDQDSITVKNPGVPGVCMISGSRSLIPIFHISSCAIPSLFVRIQTSMHFRFARSAFFFVAHAFGVYKEDRSVTNEAEDLSFRTSTPSVHGDFMSVAPQGFPERGIGDAVASVVDNSVRELSHSAAGLHKPALRHIQLRSSRKIQKRSSLRRKRGRSQSAFRSQKSSGALHSGVLRIRQDGVQLAATAPSHVRSDKRSSATSIKELKSAVGILMQDECASSCSANLLISEAHKCYREEGATITLELSASNQWSISILKDGTKRYNLIAQKAMRPSWNNRFTHATIWMGDGGWKLEFLNKRDWLIFKELYKACYDRNMQIPSTSVIPVPRVQEVSSAVDTNDLPYVRPDSYITMKDDELIRVLEKNGANYDMDSEDEVWLSKLNDEICAGRELQELIKPNSFELIIDAIEKALHCNPDDHLDERAAYDFCMHLERREVVEAIHNYWIKKRKQSHSTLVRIFQLYQPRRTHLIPKSVLRKKRSFKRQTSKVGSSKQRPLMQAIAAKQDASAHQNAQKLQEATAAAERSEGLAILKRQRAQKLMENADLATYKALMALRIAEAAQTAENLDTVTSSSVAQLTKQC